MPCPSIRETRGRNGVGARFKVAHFGDLAIDLGPRQMPARAGLRPLSAFEMERLHRGQLVPSKPEPRRCEFIEIAAVGLLFFGQHAAFTRTDAGASVLGPFGKRQFGRFRQSAKAHVRDKERDF